MPEPADPARLDLLLRVYPPELVDQAVAACGRTEQRRRLLSARLMVYFVLGMALFSPSPYLDVMRRLVSELHWPDLPGDHQLPSKASIYQARQRLGSGPLRALFHTAVHPLAMPGASGTHWRGRRLLVLAEQHVRLPAGTPGTARLRVDALVEGGTGVVLDAAWATPDAVHAPLCPAGPDALLLADRLSLNGRLADALTDAGAGFVWRLPAGRAHGRPHGRLPDGTFLVGRLDRPLRALAPDVLTTLLDPAEAPAAELLDALGAGTAAGTAALTEALHGADHAAGPLTSRTPGGIHQEVYGRLLVHHALRHPVSA
ncbi:transposase domain-containing protein [Kitasatospora sp. NPDC052896]|uniref:transposase domain-containing protein n=1 Tax=Kitasatospora sp. NPDC052896 TaxID=3364061 RepID=UPI0037CB5AD0